MSAQKKRDLIREILERRTRNKRRLSRLVQAEQRLLTLERALHALARQRGIPQQCKREMYRYVPVALVAITEGYCKMLYRDLIDAGDPFLGNAAKLPNLRLDLNVVVETHRGTATIGEVIAQQLPHNDLADIEANLGHILSQDFPAAFTERLKSEDKDLGGAVFQKYLRRIVVSTFRQRHIYCHEIANSIVPRLRDLETAAKAFRVFVRLIEEHVNAVVNSARGDSRR